MPFYNPLGQELVVGAPVVVFWQGQGGASQDVGYISAVSGKGVITVTHADGKRSKCQRRERVLVITKDQEREFTEIARAKKEALDEWFRLLTAKAFTDLRVSPHTNDYVYGIERIEHQQNFVNQYLQHRGFPPAF